MNFHISNLSPLRPRFSSASVSGSRPPSSSSRGHPSPWPKIAVEPADDSSDTGSPSSSSTDEDNDVTQDSLDVLVQRLTDLAERLGATGDAHVRTPGIEALHRHVDEMERVLVRNGGARSGGAGSRRQSRRGSAVFLPTTSLQLPTGGSADGGESAGLGRDAFGVMAPMSPSWLISHFQRRPTVHLERPAEEPVKQGLVGPDGSDISNGKASKEEALQAAETPQVRAQRPIMNRLASLDSSTTAPRISSQVAEDAIKEAEKLCAEMATVITSLQTRREESDHLQTILIQREALSYQRLHETTLAATELEDVVADNEAELRHLRLELRALEVQCMNLVPQGTDPKLEQSIRNWKDDWRALRDKHALRKAGSSVSADDSSTM